MISYNNIKNSIIWRKALFTKNLNREKRNLNQWSEKNAFVIIITFIAEAIFFNFVDLVIISSIVSTFWGSSSNFRFRYFLKREILRARFKISSCSLSFQQPLFIFMKRQIFITACEVSSYLFDSIIVNIPKLLSTTNLTLSMLTSALQEHKYLEPHTKFSKRGSLTGPQLWEGGCRKRGR